MKILRDVSSGLAHMHKLKFIHRDIKVPYLLSVLIINGSIKFPFLFVFQPHNILVQTKTKDGSSVLIGKVADLGSSLYLRDGSNIHEPSGTIGYIGKYLLPIIQWLKNNEVSYAPLHFFVAPEVLSPCEYSFPSDVFSFAMVAWETISSDTISKVPENPFIQGDASEVYSKVMLVNLR